MSSSKKIQRLGNSKQVSPARKWCFTFNNYEEGDIDKIISSDSSIKYSIGKETGENGTKHLQGYIEFDVKKRPTSIFKFTNKIHWEVALGTKEQNLIYTQKDGDYIQNFVELIDVDEMYG